MRFSLLKRNILANYASQFYIAIVGIVLIPVYIDLLGTEGYGLIGFYIMLQAWFMLFDFGLMQTMMRTSSTYCGGKLSIHQLRSLLRTLEVIFFSISILACLAFVLASDRLATSWFNPAELTAQDIQWALILMIIVVVLRWASGLYRGVIRGFERIVWLSGFNTLIATLRFVFVIPVLMFVEPTVIVFFAYQIVISIVDLAVLVFYAYRLLPVPSLRVDLVDLKGLKGHLDFAFSTWLITCLWMVFTQTDRLVLSGFVELSAFSYFTIGVLLASGITILTGPLASALLPRLTNLYAQGDFETENYLYSLATQVVVLLASSAAAVMIFYAREILLIWTGNETIASASMATLQLYAAGNFLLALSAFPYYKQFARGAIRPHLVANILAACMFIPFLLFMIKSRGVDGAGIAWLTLNLFFFMIYVPIVHEKFLAVNHWRWVVRNILRVGVLPFGIVFIASRFTEIADFSRAAAIAFLAALTVTCCLASFILSDLPRELVRHRRSSSRA